jgi:hypothetical protein
MKVKEGNQVVEGVYLKEEIDVIINRNGHEAKAKGGITKRCSAI